MQVNIQRGVTAPYLQPLPALEEMIHTTALLKEQRKIIIDNLLGDIGAYLQYRFSVTATRSTFEEIRKAIEAFGESPLSTDVCKAAVADVRRGLARTAKANLFYREIDKLIGAILYPAQLELGIGSSAWS
jgi:hypothetical protein